MYLANEPFDNKPNLELLQLVGQKKKTKVYPIDKIITEQGHISLRLPSHHLNFNPIGLVWASSEARDLI